jgi:hypothetical protein
VDDKHLRCRVTDRKLQGPALVAARPSARARSLSTSSALIIPPKLVRIAIGHRSQWPAFLILSRSLSLFLSLCTSIDTVAVFVAPAGALSAVRCPPACTCQLCA